MLDPRIAHHIDYRALRALLPNAGASVDISEIRREFARYLSTPAGRRHTSWQEAWNALTGAAERRPGRFTTSPAAAAPATARASR